MRVLQLYLSVLMTGFFACKNKQDQLPDLRVPGFEKAESFFNVNNDSAFYYFNSIATSTTDSLQIAMAYTYMGIIQAYEGDYYGSQESLLKSLSFLDEHKEADKDCLLSNYHELGNNSLSLKNYDFAIDYYDKSLKYITDEDSKVIALNDKAVAYQKKGAYAQADTIYRSIINQIKHNQKEYARILSNYAKTKWLQNSGYPAGSDLLTALHIREEIQDKRGLNASYAHLTDYYAIAKPDSALFYAEKMYQNARQINSPDDELEALTKLMNLSPVQLLKRYFIRYQYLNDSIQIARNAAKNQFALIRFEAERNKADNLQLQKDNAQKEVQLIRQQAIFGLIVLVIIALVIVLIFWHRKRKQEIEAASQHTINEYQLKTSQKVHDVVANGLYRIMTSIEHQDTIDKEPLLDKIEILYEQSRDISYEQPASLRHDFQSVIAELLTSFAGPTTKVLFTGNNQVLWDYTNTDIQHEVEQVLQELMINMKKHSAAQNVVLKFEYQDGLIQIQYIDDGVGLPSTFKYGNGLTNTENRIDKIGGHFTFDKTIKGLKLLISFPTVHSK